MTCCCYYVLGLEIGTSAFCEELICRAATEKLLDVLRLFIFVLTQSYVLKISPNREKDSPQYQIKSSFPNKVFDDPLATLKECGLVPNATLHLLARKT